jgi:hypothetical protein
MLVTSAGADPAPRGTRHGICTSFAAAQRLVIGALVEKVAVAFSRFFRRLTVSLELTVWRRIPNRKGVVS